MKRLSHRLGLLAYLLLIGLLLAPTLARAEDFVALRPAPAVEGDVIALSDLFDGVAEAADVTVARAPAPGATVSIDPAWLQNFARRAGVAWPNAAGVRRVTVRRLAQEVSADALTTLLADALSMREHAAFGVSLASAQPLYAPLGAPLAPEVRALTLDELSHTFTAEVALSADLPSQRLTGRAEASVTLPVLVHAVARGATITAGDLTDIELPARRASADAVLDGRDLVGMAARRALRPGVPLRANDVERPAVIARGDVVTVRFERGALALTARARALGDVAEGEQARFVNLQSNRVIEAVASGPGEAWLVAAPSVVAAGG